MSEFDNESKSEVSKVVESEAAPIAEPVAADVHVKAADTPVEPPTETPAEIIGKVAEIVEQPIVLAEAATTETVEKVVDEFENLTIFGNKSLDELQKIQSKKSHLSAGILFTDPSLKM